jgi:two-component system response regulator MprA
VDRGMRVLIVDDEPMVCDVLARYLTRSGFVAQTAADGESALAAFDASRPDLVLLDLMLPRIDGFSVFRSIRARGATPVIMLTARKEETERIAGLELGADDYVAKPFAIDELVARIRAVLRRRGAEALDRLSYDDLVCDLGTREVTRAGRRIELTVTEFDVLTCLVRNARRIQSRETLLRIVWGYDVPVDSNVVDVHIGHLRRKLGDPPLIHTMRGIGYVLRSQH